MSQVNFTQEPEAMSFLTKEFVALGIVTKEDMQAKIAEVVATIPETTRAAFGDNDTVAAANFWPMFQESSKDNDNAGNNEGGPLNIQTNGTQIQPKRQQAERFESPILNDEQKARVQAAVEQTQQQRISNTPQTKVLKLLVQAPKPSDLLGDAKVRPEIDEAKLAEYEKQLVQTEENIANFNKLKAANKKELVEIYKNDKNQKIVGAKVETPAIGDGKSGNEKLTLTNDTLSGFLSTRVIGRIPSTPVLGVELQSIRRVKKSGRHTDAANKMGKPNLRWVGKNAALEDPATYVEVTTETVKVGGKVETREQRQRTQLSFQILTGEKDSKGNPKMRTIRLSGNVAVPRLQRKEEYRGMLGELSDNKTLSPFLSPEEKSEALQRTVDLLSAAVGSSLVGGSAQYGTEFDAIVKEINESSQAQAANAAAAFE